MRRILLVLALTALLLMPAAAQDRLPIPDISRYAEYAPADSVLYAFIRMDTGYREQTDALLARLAPLIGDTQFGDFLYDLFGSDTSELFQFMGDAIGITVLSPDAPFHDLFDDDSPVVMNIGVRDIEAAKAFIEDTFEAPTAERNGWLIYEFEGDAGVLLRGDIMLVSPKTDVLRQIASGDYAKLSNAPEFTETIARLPEDRYDFLVYSDIGAIIEAISSRGEPDVTDAVSGLFRRWAIGGVNVGGRDLLVDVAWNYGDLDAIREFGFFPGMLTSTPLDFNFAQHVSADTQFYLQSTDFGGTLAQMFRGLNILGGLLEHDVAMDYFGLDDLLTPTTGDRLKAALSMGLQATTGLNLQSDVIEPLDGDYALHFNIVANGQISHFSAGIILTEDGQGERFETAVINSLDRAGLPITRVPIRGMQVIDLSVVTNPLMPHGWGNAALADDPDMDVWFGRWNDVMSIGTAPSVRFALQPGEFTLADSPAFQHAVASTFLSDAQAIAFINIAALQSENDDLPVLIDLVESASASMRSDEHGVVGRLALTLK